MRGDVLFFEDIPSLTNTVFIDPNWLLNVVLGRALCPEGIAFGGLNPRNGEVSWSDVVVGFRDTGIEPELVVDVLRSARLCFEVPERDGQRHFMLPSRLTEGVLLEEVWQLQPGKWAGYGGRRLVLGDAALVFPAGFFARVQAKLYESFGDTLQLWRDAFAALVGGAECVGIYRNDQEVDVWVRWLDDADCNAWEMMNQVRSEQVESVWRCGKVWSGCHSFTRRTHTITVSHSASCFFLRCLVLLRQRHTAWTAACLRCRLSS